MDLLLLPRRRVHPPRYSPDRNSHKSQISGRPVAMIAESDWLPPERSSILDRFSGDRTHFIVCRFLTSIIDIQSEQLRFELFWISVEHFFLLPNHLNSFEIELHEEMFFLDNVIHLTNYYLFIIYYSIHYYTWTNISKDFIYDLSIDILIDSFTRVLHLFQLSVSVRLNVCYGGLCVTSLFVYSTTIEYSHASEVVSPNFYFWHYTKLIFRWGN